jgi:predicted transglutaminase-like cysteine proteinase
MNTKFAKFVFGAALAVAAFQAVPAMAIGVAPTHVQNQFETFQVAILPPVGMLVFCRGHGSQCRADSVSTVAMSPDLLSVLQAINTRVNSSIRPRHDTGRDTWTVGSSSGDCEDYALTKRAALIRKGIPAGALRIATTTTRRGEPHAILVVKTSRGDFVLDNLRADVRTLGSTGYRIRTISTRDPRVWAAG